MTWWLERSMTRPRTDPMAPSVAWTCSPRLNRHLTEWDGVVGDGLGHVPDDLVQSEVGTDEDLAGRVVGMPAARRQELALLGERERLELGHGAVEIDPVGCGPLHGLERHQPSEPLAVGRLDHEMRDVHGGGVDAPPGSRGRRHRPCSPRSAPIVNRCSSVMLAPFVMRRTADHPP